jgi:hypothetical protein
VGLFLYSYEAEFIKKKKPNQTSTWEEKISCCDHQFEQSIPFISI